MPIPITHPIAIQDFLDTKDPLPAWACEPYIAQGGITFLHGKTSLGKSPLTWEMARCVSQGKEFLGQFATTPQRVLYVEADTPGTLLRPRLSLLPTPLGEWDIACVQNDGLDLAQPSDDRLKALAKNNPTVVFWNTLRSLTAAKLSDGDTPMRVYRTLRKYFPGAAHVIVHHDRKAATQKGAVRVLDEEFSGSNAWLDIAQVGLHLRSSGNTKTGEKWLVLEHTKAQASAQEPELKLTLASDGTSWLLHDRNAAFRLAYEGAITDLTPAGSKEHRVIVMGVLNIKESAFYDAQVRMKLALHSGHSAPLKNKGRAGVAERSGI